MEAKLTDEAEEPEPEHKERIMMVLKFTVGLGLFEAGVTEFKDIDWKEQQQLDRELRGCLLAARRF